MIKKIGLILFISITLVSGIILTNPFLTTMLNQRMNSYGISNNDINDDNNELVDIDDKLDSKEESDPVTIEQPPLPDPKTVPLEMNPEVLAATRELEVLRLVNYERQTYGSNPLTYMTTLEKGANIRALEIIKLWSHTRPDGTIFVTAFEYMTYAKIGENLASGPETPNEVVAGWMSSEGHRRNMLDGDYEHMAISVSEDEEGRLYWVQIFYRGR